MDRHNVEKIWKNLQKYSNAPEATFKGECKQKENRLCLAQLSFSQQEMKDLFANSQSLTQIQSMEEQNTFIDSSSFASSQITDTPLLINYEVLEEIARGGMGVIFKGTQHSLQRQIAIKKLISNEDIPDLKDKFINEAIVTAYLDHPNIIPVYELGENEEGDVILVMKLVVGTSWKEILKTKTRSQKDVFDTHLDILMNVCNAVAFAHSKRIVHCDLKPENVMIGEFGEVLLMDWGIAVDISAVGDKKALGKENIDTPMGTPHYMPKELAEGDGESIGPWTDTYLLGGILYEIITTKPPHSGSNIWEVVSCAVEGVALEFQENTPKELREICRKSLQKDVKKRYSTVDEFQTALKEFIKHKESHAISSKAKKTLDECEHIVLKVTSSQLMLQKRERGQLYEKFAQTIAGFQQAIELWRKNPSANKEIKKARFIYGKIALHNGDLGLAEAQILKLPNSAEIKELREKVQKKKMNAMRQFKTTQRLKWALKIAAVIILIVFGVSTEIIRRENARTKAKAYEATMLQKEKTYDAYQSRIKLAKIALSKAEEARVYGQWGKLGVYAAEALEYIKNINEKDNFNLSDITTKAEYFFTLAISKEPLLWQTYGQENIFQKKIDAIAINQLMKKIACATNKNIYLFSLSGELLSTLKLENAVVALSFSSENIASVSKDGIIKIRDIQIGNIIETYTSQSKISSIQYLSDSENIAYIEKDTIKVWNTRENTHSDLFKHKNAYLLQSRKKLLISQSKNVVKLWNIATGALINKILAPGVNIEKTAFSDNFLASVYGNNLVNIFSIATGKTKHIITEKQIETIALFKNTLFVAFNDQTIKLWDNRTGEMKHEGKFPWQIMEIYRMSEEKFLFISTNYRIFIWNSKSKKIQNNFSGHKKNVTVVKFSNDGKKIASASLDKTINIWETETGKLLQTLRGHTGGITCLSFSPDDEWLISGSEAKDSSSILWNINTGNKHEIHEHNNLDVHSLAFNNNNKLAIGSAENVAMLFEIDTKKQHSPKTKTIAIFQNCGNTAVKHLFFDNQNELISICDNSNVIKWWDIKQNSYPKWKKTVEKKILSAAITPNRKILVTILEDNSLHFWDVESKYSKYLKYKIDAYSSKIENISLSNTMLVFSTEKAIKVLNIETGQLITEMKKMTPISSLSLSPEKNLLAVATQNQVKLLLLPVIIKKRLSSKGKNVITSYDANYIVLVSDKKRNGKYIEIMNNEKKEIVENHFIQKINENIDFNRFSVVFHPRKNIILFNGKTNIMALNLFDGKISNYKKITEPLIGYNHDGSILATGDNIEIVLYEMPEMKRLPSIKLPANNNKNKKAIVKFSEDNLKIVIVFNKEIIVHEIKTGKIKKIKENTKNTKNIEFKNNKLFIAQDNIIEIWNPNTGKKETSIKTQGKIIDVSIRKNYLVLITDLGIIETYDIVFLENRCSFSTHDKTLNSISFLGDDSLVSVSEREILIWNMYPNKNIRASNKNNLDKKFRWNKSRNAWEIEINLEHPKKTAESLFGYKVEDDFSTIKKLPILYLWK